MNPAAWMFLGVTIAFIFWRAIRRWRFHMPDDAHFCWRCHHFGRIRMDGYMTCIHCGASDWIEIPPVMVKAPSYHVEHKTPPNLKIVK